MNLLVIKAHPQYAGMFISGTFYKHLQQGDQVTVATLSDAEGLTNLKPINKIGEMVLSHSMPKNAKGGQ